MYSRAFAKDRELKIGSTGDFEIGLHAWAAPWQVERISYAELEARLDRQEKR